VSKIERSSGTSGLVSGIGPVSSSVTSSPRTLDASNMTPIRSQFPAPTGGTRLPRGLLDLFGCFRCGGGADMGVSAAGDRSGAGRRTNPSPADLWGDGLSGLTSISSTGWLGLGSGYM
jgi:hypothetical protein